MKAAQTPGKGKVNAQRYLGLQIGLTAHTPLRHITARLITVHFL